MPNSYKGQNRSVSLFRIPLLSFVGAVQVLPQLLNHLGIDDEQTDALDWGTIAVYTCAASCAGPAYCEEVAWVQP